MIHFGIICPTSPGHLNPMMAIGGELKRRGHRVTQIQILDAEAQTLAAGLEFLQIGENEFPKGVLKNKFAKLGKLSGLAAVRYTVELIKQGGTIVLRDAPKAIQEAGIEALLVDQVSAEGATVAEYLGLPFITICNALILNQEPGIPPFVTPWVQNKAWWSLLRNSIAYSILEVISQPIRSLVNDYRKEWNLPPYKEVNDVFSRLAQISQQPKEFEFPRTQLPKSFYFTSPFSDPASRVSIDFPNNELTGKPLIYASMGTLQNQRQEIFSTIAEACVRLDCQLVISLGGSAKPESLPNLPGSPLVVEYAPQLELLQKATLTITHAGMNTVLESLSYGVPMVAIPITNDQPGVGARLTWTGAGEVVSLSSLSVPRLRSAVQKVLTQESYKNNASRLQEAIRMGGGVSRAADIIEQAITYGTRPDR